MDAIVRWSRFAGRVAAPARKAFAGPMQVALAALALAVALPADAVTIDWVTVGDAGNAADTTSYGSVGYSYQIMKYEWTNSQYVQFLNAVDPQGTNPNKIYRNEMGVTGFGGITNTGGTSGSWYAVKPNMGDKPVNFVNWFDAARVANWLQNGAQTYPTTDASASAPQNTGAYTLGTATGGNAPAKNPGAQYWIPTENEWYKAAFYQGSGTNAGYWQYATQVTGTAPIAVGATVVGTGSSGGVSPVITGNFANWNNTATWSSGTSNVTTVGSNGGPSAYQTFDMSGNVWEWNDLDGTTSGTTRGFRGGSVASTNSADLSTTGRVEFSAEIPVNEGYRDLGFRLASPAGSPPGVPEIDPAGMASVFALVTGALGLRERRRAKRRA